MTMKRYLLLLAFALVPFFAFGPTLHKYTGGGGKGGSNDAAPEFIDRCGKSRG